MNRLYSFFVCMVVLAACSPRVVSGEQVAKTVTIEATVDSASIKEMVDRLVREEMQRKLDISELLNQTTTREVFTAPDSSGAQHLQERITTTLSRQKNTSAGSSYAKSDEVHAKVDSSAIKTSDSLYVREERIAIKEKRKGSMPWYIYVAGLLAAMVMGFLLAVRGKKWFGFLKIFKAL